MLKPDFTSTFSRGVLRLLGTFVGLGIATGLFHALPRTMPVEIGLIMGGPRSSSDGPARRTMACWRCA